MKNLLLIWLGLVFSSTFWIGCSVYEAAVEDIARDTSVESSETTTTISVTPTNPTVTGGSQTTFSASGATTPLTWSVSDTNLGSIDSASGTFTASSSNAGTLTVTVTDADGDTGTSTIIVS